MTVGNVTNIYHFHDRSQKIDHIENYYDFGSKKRDCFDDVEEADFEEVDDESETKPKVSSSRKGRPKEYLFADAKGNKDEEVTVRQAGIFVAFLKKHNIYSKKIDTKSATYFNQSIIAFYRIWEEENLVPRKSPKCNALIRFLVEDCRLQVDVDSRTYSSFIGKLLNSDEKLDYKVESDVYEFVEEYKL